MLRKREIIESVGMAKSTVSDWIIEFQVYIPTVKEGAVTYYLPEAIDVLLVIKELREQQFNKSDIMRLLGERGFPITVEDAVEINEIIQKADYREGLLSLMKTMSEGMVQVGKQNERLERHEERLQAHDQRADEQNERIRELEQVMKELQKELAATKEQMNRPRWFEFWKQGKG